MPVSGKFARVLHYPITVLRGITAPIGGRVAITNGVLDFAFHADPAAQLEIIDVDLYRSLDVGQKADTKGASIGPVDVRIHSKAGETRFAYLQARPLALTLIQIY